ncbi:hypothetical protein CGZ90_19970, partial [Fictibacillus aquaticus]
MNQLNKLHQLDELWQLDILITLLGFGLIYFLIINRMKILNPTVKIASWKQQLSFSAGLLLLMVSEGSPLSLIGHHYLFSVHMIQMTITYIMVPPLLILGMPSWMFKPFAHIKVVRRICAFLSNPILAVVLFNGLFSFYHFP